MVHKILVALDRSETAAKVLDQAIALAQATGASLMLLHVLSSEDKGYPVMPTATALDYYPIDGRLFEEYSQYWQVYENQGLELLRSYTDQAMAAGVRTEFTQNPGNAGRTICEMAQSCGADLIVMGRRGHSGWNEILLGSVSNYVLHHARCSVFTVQGPALAHSEVSPRQTAAAA